jgi:hypothetical protein
VSGKEEKEERREHARKEQLPLSQYLLAFAGGVF